MKIYTNGKDTEKMGYVKHGFMTALVDDAHNNLRDDDHKEQELGAEVYAELCDYDFTTENISEEAVDKATGIVDEFFDIYLNDGQKRKITGMTREEQIGFGIDLYQSLLYDNAIMEEEFRPAVSQFHPVDTSASIGESVDGDIRIFFE